MFKVYKTNENGDFELVSLFQDKKEALEFAKTIENPRVEECHGAHSTVVL